MKKKEIKTIVLPFILIIILLFLPQSVFGQRKDEHVTSKGETYVGEWHDGEPHGKGKIIYKSGDFYEGNFHKGKRQGYGVYTFTDGEKYEGEWYQGQQHGHGVYYFGFIRQMHRSYRVEKGF